MYFEAFAFERGAPFIVAAGAGDRPAVGGQRPGKVQGGVAEAETEKPGAGRGAWHGG
jgi:hypothetical protein